ncbi:MAG TPA: hypothetical protein VFU31_05500 [Candidatus Binatia bacterium]|nr:hypothetical protein [Candidatus Binatia bacterium]
MSPETNKKQYTVFDQITIDRLRHGDRSDERLYIMMSHFMVDEKNQFIGEEKGMKILEKLTSEDSEQVIKQFLEAFQNTAVNPPSGNGSTSTPEAGLVETLPAGSQR